MMRCRMQQEPHPSQLLSLWETRQRVNRAAHWYYSCRSRTTNPLMGHIRQVTLPRYGASGSIEALPSTSRTLCTPQRGGSESFFLKQRSAIGSLQTSNRINVKGPFYSSNNRTWSILTIFPDRKNIDFCQLPAPTSPDLLTAIAICSIK